MSANDYLWEQPTRNPKPGKLQLTEQERNWVKLKWGKVRRAQREADKSGNEWNLLNDAINVYLDQSGESDIVQRTSIKSKSIPLKDALETGKWHSAEAQRHIDDIQLFLRLKELEIL
jgi:hypothetical protein